MRVSSFLVCIYAMALVLSCSNSGEREQKLVWSDEFNVDGAPDSTKWGYDLGNGCPRLCGWGNNELQAYTSNPKNVYVKDGNLVITAYLDSLDERAYTSSRLVTRDKAEWKYGKIEARAKIPRGLGTWSAIWMLPSDRSHGQWPRSGEIDIMEHVGCVPDTVYSTIHTQAYNWTRNTQKTGQSFLEGSEDEFRIFAMEWSEDEMSFYVDHKKFFTFENKHQTVDEWPFDKPFHLILNLAVGGNWGGKDGVDPGIFPKSMVVDYVRVYQ